VARASLLTLNSDLNRALNIGTAVENDVNAIFRTLNEAGNFGAPEKHGPAKKGEQLRSVIDWRLANKLVGWEPQVQLQEGLKLTLNYFMEKHG